MTDVTMVGLGAMGSALVRAFIGAGHSVTIWNRTPARMEPLVSLGATATSSPGDAAKASPVTVVCIDNYDATRRLINEAGMLEPLSGRTVIQFSTGTPAEARDLSNWLTARGVNVLDGAIMAYPSGIGAKDAKILLAGPAEIYSSCKPILDCLGGDLRHVSEEIGAAAVLDMALLTFALSKHLGVWHGARACEAEGLGIDVFASMLPPYDPVANLAWRIHNADYDNPGATLEVWNAALDRIIQHADTAKINREVPELVSSLFRRAIALGHGNRDIATVIEVLRAG
jgi:3-hydroxyisobutyrate dehydrogenase-like beta-hydroxyacid dehydrogenase